MKFNIYRIFSDNYKSMIKEMAALKSSNRCHILQSTNPDSSKDDVIISIMADLQQKQDQENELIMKYSIEKVFRCFSKLNLH